MQADFQRWRAMEESAAVHTENTERLWLREVSDLNSWLRSEFGTCDLKRFWNLGSQKGFGGCSGRGGWQVGWVLSRKVMIVTVNDMTTHQDATSKQWWLIISNGRQGEPILVQNLFNVAILNVLWVIVASHRWDFEIIKYHCHADNVWSGTTCQIPRPNTLLDS